MFQKKERDKTPEKQQSEVETGLPPKKTTDSKDDPRSWKKNGGTD